MLISFVSCLRRTRIGETGFRVMPISSGKAVLLGRAYTLACVLSSRVAVQAWLQKGRVRSMYRKGQGKGRGSAWHACLCTSLHYMHGCLLLYMCGAWGRNASTQTGSQALYGKQGAAAYKHARTHTHTNKHTLHRPVTDIQAR